MMSTLVIETAWPEFSEKLPENKESWLPGSRGAVHYLFLARWTQLSRSRVRGHFEMHHLDNDGTECLVWQGHLFPIAITLPDNI